MFRNIKIFVPIIVVVMLSFGASDLRADDEVARAEERADLLAALKAAPNEQVANAAVSAIWEHWQTAPDEKAQKLLDSARQRMRVADFDGAMEHLDELVAYAPDYSEGWNTRATTLFLQQKYDRSLEDVIKTLELEPAHFGALTGRAIILMRQGRVGMSQRALRRAVEVNPYLRERSLLIEPKE